ncbi:MAG TPA: hypothetical protein VFE33_00915 [Thermoanaerobaculia bacterium]|nr:hypothetical protein [Thermoanaerobaculia bacterium]
MSTSAKKLSLLFGLMIVLAATLAMATTPMPRPGVHSEHFTGALANLALGARFTQPFTLTVDRYSTEADLQRWNDILVTRGPYALRDELWKQEDGHLSVGGRLGYPVAAVVSRETPAGRTLLVLFNRPLRNFEVSRLTRSSKYQFSYIELNLDRNDQGNGELIAAAKLRPTGGNNLEVESLGVQPFRLLDVRAN